MKKENTAPKAANTATGNGSSRKWIFRIGALLIVAVVCVIMFIIGRGHTVYFDNTKIEYNGKTLNPYYKVDVVVKGEKVAKLREKERGMTSTMGQSFEMDLVITEEKDGPAKTVHVGMALPYSIDGIVVNLPALMAGAPEDVYLSEFVSQAVDTSADDEDVVITDEFELPMEEGDSSEEG